MGCREHELSALLIFLSLSAIVVSYLLWLWHYSRSLKKLLPPAVVANGGFGRKFKVYFAHHRPVAMVFAGALAIFLSVFGIGVVSAGQPKADVQAVATAPSAQPQASTLEQPSPSTSPSPSLSPSPSRATPARGTYTATCPAFPAFPDEFCTGWKHSGVTLRNCDAQTDKFYIWNDGKKTFDSCYFSKSLTIEGANVTITRSQIHGSISTHWTHNYDFRGLTLTDVEIEDTGNANAVAAAVAGHNFTCTRCNVHHTGTGIHFGDNTVIRDSYTHDLNYTDEAHGTGVGTGQGNGSNSQIIHNNIQCNRLPGQPKICSSALSIYPEENKQGGTVHNVRVEKNLFNTTGAYCVYAGGLPATNIDFIDNMFGKKFTSKCAGYGPVASYQPAGGKWINNVWADGSGPVVP